MGRQSRQRLYLASPKYIDRRPWARSVGQPVILFKVPLKFRVNLCWLLACWLAGLLPLPSGQMTPIVGHAVFEEHFLFEFFFILPE